jgi:hypothetical protein
MKVPSIPCSAVPVTGLKDPESSVSLYWLVLAL